MSTYPFPQLPPEPLADAVDDDHHHSNSKLVGVPNGGNRLFPLPPPPATASSPMLSSHPATISPTLTSTHTPAESIALSSEFSVDFDIEDQTSYLDDVVFGSVGGSAPSFLAGDIASDLSLFAPLNSDPISTSYTTPERDISAAAVNGEKTIYPLSPDKTPSLNTSPPQRPVDKVVASRSIASVTEFRGVICPDQLSNKDDTALTPFPDLQAFLVDDVATQLTPDTASSGDSLRNPSRDSVSTEDGRGPGAAAAASSGALPMATPNPHVRVSVWGKDESIHNTPPPVAAAESDPLRIGVSADDSVLPSKTAVAISAVSRNEQGAWSPNTATGLRGVDPTSRPSTELPTSINEAAQQREVHTRNTSVSEWLSRAEESTTSDPTKPSLQRQDTSSFEGVSDREIPLGNETQNIPQAGQTYFNDSPVGPPTAADYELMLQGRLWDDRPARLPISQGGPRYQPESSQAAIERFERMYHDNVSIISRAATWGTRRRSLPSIADFEEVTSGNILKKLSLSKGDTRRPSILGNLRTLVRIPSTSQLKRSRSHASHHGDDQSSTTEDPYSPTDSRRDSKSTLAPPSRTQSWAKSKQPMPSINTALASMGSSVASIGTTHARSGSVSRPHAGSISLSPPLSSPKSPLLKVSNSLRRPRSKSDLTKSTMDNSHPNLVRMLKMTGGPPVAKLASGSGPTSHAIDTSSRVPTPIMIPATKVAVPDPDDDDEDDDEPLEDGDIKTESDELIDRITPDFNGFRELVLGLNPMLAEMNTYLVDRIAHQQIVRYKNLLNSKVKHLSLVKAKTCPNQNLCIGLGGTANLLDSRGDPRSVDPLSTAYDPSGDDDMLSPMDGAINAESFPKYIPMPPTASLPAEFECQLCFQTKPFTKPSDWTKHVHEDVQPFTCTWDRCRDPKIFKRKADWVRHENEGHRHLEWWTCDVEECRHTCYRRDNFLQHLVREHKFEEPKHKTKAAIKRAGTTDGTWKRVERCHSETSARPQDEPCRFCGKTFPTWKKLTVHLAKHMEHISLPILRLVERKEVEADTIISPVQDPPQRTFPPTAVFPSPDQQQPRGGVSTGGGVVGGLSPNLMATGQGGLHQIPTIYAPADQTYIYPPVSQVPFHTPYYGPTQFGGAGGLGVQMQNLDAATMDMASVGFTSGQQYTHTHMPVTTAGYLASTPNQYITEAPGIDPSYSNALGVQGTLVGGHLPYDTSVDPSVGTGPDQFTPHGSASPFGHSPHQGQGHFYH